jgi:hypothetical protein
MKNLDRFRLEILRYLVGTESFKSAWVVWNIEVQKHLNNKSTAQDIFNFGELLSEVFSSNDVGRTQSSVSGGGTAWECLITWYLNLIFWGTDVIITRQNKSFVPQIVSDSLAVTISNHKTNTESDIVAYSVPEIQNLNTINLDILNELISSNIKKCDLAVIQCKTNWNDNAQIPMLWDLIYNSSSFRIPNVSVGVKGVNPASYNNFSYSFITVPTVKKIPKPSQLAVLRVKNLTGGNYWGKKSLNGVSSCLNEFCGRNFGNYFNGGVQTHISNNLNSDPEYLNRFLNHKF